MMNCPNILAPANEDLLSLVYDEAALSAQKQAHFDQCPLCQQRLANYNDINNTLLTKLYYRRLCPSAIRLNYYCLDVVPAEERINIASHLLDCPYCADEIVEIRRVQAAFEPFPTTSPSLGTVVHRLIATLVIQQAKPIMRSEAQTTGWPRQYQAGTLDLSLHVSHQSSGETMLIGILTSSDPAITGDAFEGAEALLYPTPSLPSGNAEKSTEPLLIAQVDEIGNLLLEPIPAGTYTMLIRLPDQEIVIEGLTI
ncbi:MAG: hypothetical protein ACRDHZ_14085 [Ktedonobacteraceae bacterium]